MASKWREVPLAELCDRVYSGGTPRATVREYFEGGHIPWLRTKEVSYNKIQATENFITEAGLANSSAKMVPVNTVIVAMYGDGDTAGRVAINKIPLTTNQACCNLLINGSIADYRFVYYVLKSRYRDLVDLKNGGGQQNLNAQLIKTFRILLPSRAEQASLSALLECLDDKLDALALQNLALERIARAIFKSWFVDFDPVRAKAERRDPEEMDAAIASLFPSEFDESRGVSIPVGWITTPLDSIATFLNGIALQKYPALVDEDSLPAIKIAQLKRGSTESADRVSRALPPQYVIRDGDLLFSWSGSLEVEIWCGGDGALNQHLFKVTSDVHPQWFIYFWLHEHLANFREIAASKVTTMGHIQRHHLKEAIVIVPPANTLSRLGATIAPLLERMVQSRVQARTLAELRDTLLPRLISGKLRVPEAEKLVEAVL